MKLFRIICLVIFSAIDAYSIYATIGYLILGIQTPKIIGETTTTFMGMYMMSITFFVVTILATILVIYFARKLKTKK